MGISMPVDPSGMGNVKSSRSVVSCGYPTMSSPQFMLFISGLWFVYCSLQLVLVFYLEFVFLILLFTVVGFICPSGLWVCTYQSTWTLLVTLCVSRCLSVWIVAVQIHRRKSPMIMVCDKLF